MDVTGKVVIVTGSSSGIGKAVALLFAQQGAKVVVHSRTNVTDGKDVVNQITKAGGDAIYVQGDLSEESAVLELFSSTLNYFGTVDVLINNAGTSAGQPFLQTTADAWIKSLNNNLISAVLCSREAAKIMLKKGHGTIINTASIRGLEHTGREGVMAYSAAKAGLINFTKTLAKQLAPTIMVNAVAPGFVRTPPYEKMSQEQLDNFKNATLIKRLINPVEIAEAYLFLAKSEIITGEVLVVDGGFTLKVA